MKGRGPETGESAHCSSHDARTVFFCGHHQVIFLAQGEPGASRVGAISPGFWLPRREAPVRPVVAQSKMTIWSGGARLRHGRRAQRRSSAVLSCRRRRLVASVATKYRSSGASTQEIRCLRPPPSRVMVATLGRPPFRGTAGGGGPSRRRGPPGGPFRGSGAGRLRCCCGGW